MGIITASVWLSGRLRGVTCQWDEIVQRGMAGQLKAAGYKWPRACQEILHYFAENQRYLSATYSSAISQRLSTWVIIRFLSAHLWFSLDMFCSNRVYRWANVPSLLNQIMWSPLFIILSGVPCVVDHPWCFRLMDQGQDRSYPKWKLNGTFWCLCKGNVKVNHENYGNKTQNEESLLKIKK